MPPLPCNQEAKGKPMNERMMEILTGRVMTANFTVEKDVADLLKPKEDKDKSKSFDMGAMDSGATVFVHTDAKGGDRKVHCAGSYSGCDEMDAEHVRLYVNAEIAVAMAGAQGAIVGLGKLITFEDTVTATKLAIWELLADVSDATGVGADDIISSLRSDIEDGTVPANVKYAYPKDPATDE